MRLSISPSGHVEGMGLPYLVEMEAGVGGLLGARNLYKPGVMKGINTLRNRSDWVRAAGEGFNLPPGLSAAGGTGLLSGNFASDPLLRDGVVY
ncbi:hypothetical protein OAE08_02060 [Gammaproteobacteria bacterium]|nr:hypothetical protein [Gammaproteobacteria bacterium]